MTTSTDHPRASTTDFDAVIIGAGFSGLYMLHSVRDRLGLSARVFEAGNGVGGTWYWNRYPGARCDSDSYVYCYTFDKQLLQEWEWSERYPIAGFPNLFTMTGPLSPSVLSNMPVSIEQHVEWISGCIDYMRKSNLTTIEATSQAEEQWTAHVDAVVNMTLMPQADSWYMGANIAGKPRTFLPYLDPAGVGGYRQRCSEVAAKGYEGFTLRA